jgi:predicted phosphodiesterase
MLLSKSTKKYATLKMILVALWVILGTFLFIQLFAKISFKYEALSVDLQPKLGKTGSTIVYTPPFGKIVFKTHQTPWELAFTLNEVDFSRLEAQIANLPSYQQWHKPFIKELHREVRALFISIFWYGLLGGCVALLIVRFLPSSRLFWYGLLVSLVSIGIFLGLTALTFNPDSLRRPRYEGVLAATPWMMNLVNTGIDNFRVIGQNLRKVSNGLPLLYKQADQLRDLHDISSDIRVLHVSDIHNNPAAFNLINELITDFKISFVIDTGDLTDYGTALEATIIPRISDLKLPYVFVPGNHDSPLIVEHLRKIDNVTVLEKKRIEIAGLTIAGTPDPASYSYSSNMATPEAIKEAGDRLADRVAGYAAPPDIIAVHELNLAAKLIGKVPLVLHGHDHYYKLNVIKKTIIHDAGTTGASGIRGLKPKGDPYSAAVLYFKKENNGPLRVAAIDSLRINGLQGQMIVARQLY